MHLQLTDTIIISWYALQCMFQYKTAIFRETVPYGELVGTTECMILMTILWPRV